MSKHGLHGKLTATPGNVDKLKDILLKAASLVSSAKGCHLYFLSKDPKFEHAIWITEMWETKEDHDNSLKVAGVRELISQAIPLLDGNPERGQELEILGGKIA